jgi:hypothetical protein
MRCSTVVAPIYSRKFHAFAALYLSVQSASSYWVATSWWREAAFVVVGTSFDNASVAVSLRDSGVEFRIS